MNFTKIGQTIDFALCYRLQLHSLNLHFWQTITKIACQIKIEGFINALAMFVRECRNQLANIIVTNTSIDRRESDPSWVANLPVALHSSIRCWRRKGNDVSDLELLTPEHVRCSPAWQGRTEWRRDYVWVQEYDPSGNSALDGKRVGQIQAIVSVIDDSRRDGKGIPVRYTGAFVELLRLRNGGQPHKIHGMVEVEDQPQVRTSNSRDLRHCYFFNISIILRSAHVILASNASTYYVNNYVDQD